MAFGSKKAAPVVVEAKPVPAEPEPEAAEVTVVSPRRLVVSAEATLLARFPEGAKSVTFGSTSRSYKRDANGCCVILAEEADEARRAGFTVSG
jgi:hypothetical protein